MLFIFDRTVSRLRFPGPAKPMPACRGDSRYATTP
jgi:hypothetical protein